MVAVVAIDVSWVGILLEHAFGFDDEGHVLCIKPDCPWHETFHGTMEEAKDIKFSDSWQEYIEHVAYVAAINQLSTNSEADKEVN